MPIRVLSLNTWGLPYGVARDLPARTEALGSALAVLEPDVVALQEVWTPRARGRLRQLAAEAGLPHAFFVDRPRGNAGLVVFSRWPLARGEAHHFRVRGRAERVQHSDYWARKGWLDLAIETPDGELGLIDTHVHAAYADGDRPDEYAGERLAQVTELAHGLRTRAGSLLAVGDFNMHEGSEEYEVWRALSGATDVAAALDQRRATVESTHPYTPADAEDQRIDYAFTRGGLRALSIDRVLDGPVDLGARRGHYSDHHGLLIELDPSSVGASHAPSPPPARSVLERARTRLEEAAARTEARARFQTRAGVAGLVLSGAAGIAGGLRTRERRRWLRAVALGIPALTGVGSGLAVALGRGFTDAEARRFREVARLLDGFEPADPTA